MRGRSRLYSFCENELIFQDFLSETKSSTMLFKSIHVYSSHSGYINFHYRVLIKYNHLYYKFCIQAELVVMWHSCDSHYYVSFKCIGVVVDKTDGTERPHLPIYEVMLFESSSDVMLCDQQRYLLYVEKELIQPREEEVS